MFFLFSTDIFKKISKDILLQLSMHVGDNCFMMIMLKTASFETFYWNEMLKIRLTGIQPMIVRLNLD